MPNEIHACKLHNSILIYVPCQGKKPSTTLLTVNDMCTQFGLQSYIINPWALLSTHDQFFKVKLSHVFTLSHVNCKLLTRLQDGRWKSGFNNMVEWIWAFTIHFMSNSWLWEYNTSLWMSKGMSHMILRH